MSHVKNVEAFGKLTGICTGYGGSYKPGQQRLQVNALAALSKSAQQVMDEVNEAQSVYDKATNQRVQGFKDLRKLSAAVYHVLKSSGAHPLTVNDARISHGKLYGARRISGQAARQTTTSGEVLEARFSVAKDFANQVQYFAQLVETVSNEPLYQPGEERLSVTSLKKKLAEIQALNASASNAEIRLTGARRLRNELYYENPWSLVDTGVAAKQYIRGIFGFNSSQHNEVKRIQFTKPSV